MLIKRPDFFGAFFCCFTGNANLPIGAAQFANREIGVPGMCHVEKLRITLCRTCAMMNHVEENFSDVVRARVNRAALSDLSSIFGFTNAQAKLISVSRFFRFPHFHSDDYYYGLYPYFKTG
jgi:hypothetical protein